MNSAIQSRLLGVSFLYFFFGVAIMCPLNHPRANEPDDPTATEQLADVLEASYGETPPPEGAKMLMAILRGSRMGRGEGWFGPAASRYGYEWLLERHAGDDGTGGISRDRFVGPDELFAVLDRDRDGVIRVVDLDWSDDNPYVQLSYALNRIFRRLDTDGSGGLSRDDWANIFATATAGGDTMSAEDFAATLLAGEGGGFMPGDAPTKESLLKGLLAGEIGSMVEGPRVGDRAPVFQLRSPQGGEPLSLDSLMGEKPLVLVFGNFTCGPFRAFYPAVDALHAAYGDRVNFLMVYVREAHPENGWKMASNERAGVAVVQPRSLEERAEVAAAFCSRLEPRMPVVVDDVNDSVGHAYSGMPARLYLIDREGRVAFKSGRGPFGFKPEELEQAIAMNLLESTLEDSAALKNASHDADGPSSSAASWSGLPRPHRGGDGPLPNWAAAVAAELPRTAAALLELDYAHRTKSPLDPGLRARLRYVIAHVNRCEYAERTALADLRRTGASESQVEAFLKDPEGWREDERDAVEFVRRHSVDAPGIEDDLFERLRVRYGDRGAAAIVLLGAYGNFQDRLLLGLGISSEGQVPLPPLDVEFDDTVFQAQPMLPPRSAATPLIANGTDVIVDDAEWSRLSYAELKTRLKAQRQRRQRLPTPTWEDAARGLPERLAARPTRIVWNLVCFGYVPELAVPWTTATRTMWAEAAQDRVFEESLFWVQTRAVQCSYCMGHCEMLLELAGLDAPQIDERLQSLAGDDWSGFPPHQQRAFAYARKLSLTPWQLTRDDYDELERELGPKEAMAVFFWLCRGLYMTRVSDGFQLQLESTNVFADFDAANPLSKE